jgi:hypothetical protein
MAENGVIGFRQINPHFRRLGRWGAKQFFALEIDFIHNF